MCVVCNQPCDRDDKVVHGCGIITDGRRNPWCSHLGKHLKKALRKEIDANSR